MSPGSLPFQPVAGAEVALSYSGPYLTADAEGRHEGYAPSTHLFQSILRPEGYARLIYWRPVVTIAEATADFELPTIELTRGATVRDLVVDERDRPVAGALVDASRRFRLPGVEISAGPR